MIRKAIDRFALWFADSFGTETSFGIWFLLLVAWLCLMPIMGVSHWNATVGLAGNTTESTIELFLEIAILLKANQIAKQQDEHTDLLLATPVDVVDTAAVIARLEAMEQRLTGAITGAPDVTT